MRYVDVNVFVYWLGDHPEFGSPATKILERIDQGEKAVTSAITPWLIHVAFEKEAEMGYSFQALMERLTGVMNLKFAPLDMETYWKAGALSKRHGLDLEDAIHLATALQHGANVIYSNDKDFDKGPIDRVFE
ncbi:MAG: type II toxin-antitoxin system VapC family toxin [Euryarchaeota archaeon]|nr:type II toxin-antitoxin system VapC family toxin [Euryarchaeota archaeon]